MEGVPWALGKDEPRLWEERAGAALQRTTTTLTDDCSWLADVCTNRPVIALPSSSFQPIGGII